MKKLFFLFGFSLCFNFLMAQEVYLQKEDAIEAVKGYLIENPVDLSQNVPGGNDRFESAVLNGYIREIEENGNSEQVLDAYLNGLNLRPALVDKVPAVRATLKSLVSKS